MDRLMRVGLVVAQPEQGLREMERFLPERPLLTMRPTGVASSFPGSRTARCAHDLCRMNTPPRSIARQNAVGQSYMASGSAKLGNLIALASRERVMQVRRLAGVVVIVLGLLLLNRGLVNFGYGFTGLLPSQPEAQVAIQLDPAGGVQTATMALTYQGYTPNVLQVK